jgi:transposase
MAMAGKNKEMSQIKQLLQMHHQGCSIKNIARTLGMSKNTVKGYLRKLAANGDTCPELIKTEEPLLAKRFHAGNPAYKDGRYEHMEERFAYFEKELRRTGVTRHLLWTEYKTEKPSGYGYTQFNEHLNRYLQRRSPTMVLSHRPGEKLYIDFAGDKMEYIELSTGEVVACPVFVACLPYSDYGFAMAVRSQGTEDFLHALRCCLEHLDGVPQMLVPDNLKAAVVKTDRYEPDINRITEDFANHYNTVVMPARVRRPRDKALVENNVKLIYNRVFAKLRNRQFFGLGELNKAIAEKVREHNQTRMQQKPYCRQEYFLSQERTVLGPLPENPFVVKYYRELKVAQNNHVYLSQDKHYYSVPFAHTGKQVKVVYTHGMVYICADGQQVAVHERDPSPGKYTTLVEHLCSHHRHYLLRSPDYYLQKAGTCSLVLHQLVEKIFATPRPPEVMYRTCDGLLSLYRKTDAQTFDRACQIALAHQNHTYGFVKNLIENKMTQCDDPQPQQPLPKHDNIRGRDYYQFQQITIKFEAHDAN